MPVKVPPLEGTFACDRVACPVLSIGWVLAPIQIRAALANTLGGFRQRGTGRGYKDEQDNEKNCRKHHIWRMGFFYKILLLHV
ncbi:MAG: hypothetical protein ABSF13_10080 [Smithella sp.]